MEMENKNIEESPVVGNKKTMKLIKVLVAVVVVATGIVAVGPAIVPFIALMFGGAVAYG